MRPYKDFNNSKKNKLRIISRGAYSNFFNNSMLGNTTCEIVKKRIELKLATDHDRAITWFYKLHLKNNRCIDELHLIESFIQEVLYDKTSYIGTSVLDLSKLHMMQLHCPVIHKNSERKYNLVHTDTDSLVYDLRHHDIFEWINEHPKHFDLSDSKQADQQDDTNKKVVGKMKNTVSTAW